MKWKRGVMRRVATLPCVIKLLPALALLAVLPGAGSAQVPPDESWRTVRTQHFRVTFPAELEALGRRAATIAEHAYDELSEQFLEPPSGTIDLLVTDHIDISNGFAQLTPSNHITVYARPPIDDPSLAYQDDWMELVITHELAHIVHLDRTDNLVGTVARGLFGRVTGPWPFFPGSGTPRWITEGIATWYESELTGAGRVKGTFNQMVLRTAALEGRFENIGQASGGSPQWPSGTRQYAYGSMFFEHLLTRFGKDRMAAFVEAIAGQWIPYRINAAGKDAFGVSLAEEWDRWAQEVREQSSTLDARLERVAAVSVPERLTEGARWGLHPEVSPDGNSLLYVRADGKSDAQLFMASFTGTSGRTLTRTNGLATFDWTPDGRVVFAQLEYSDLHRAYSDLFVATRDGSVRRVTRGARLSDPSVGPTGDWAVAVDGGGGATGLVTVDLQTGALTTVRAPAPGVQWAFPSVSPNGRWIAATRWTRGGNHDVVILDREGALVHRVTADRALDVAPDWSPDGRYLVWGSDRSGIPNILGAPVDPETGEAGAPLLLSNVRTGATHPSVDPSGRWIYFSGYHVDGYEVERLRFDPEAAPAAPPADARFSVDRLAGSAAPTAQDQADGELRGYSAISTLWPTYWEPVLRDAVVARSRTSGDQFIPRRELLGFGVGAQTSGVDLVGRHRYAATGSAYTSGGKAAGGLSYSYAGLGNPVLGLTARQSWTADPSQVAQRDADSPIDTLFTLERSRRLSAAASFRRRKWRSSFFLTFSGGLLWEQRQLLDEALQPSKRWSLNRLNSRLSDFSVSMTYSTARAHSFQMGAARGATLFVRGRTLNELSLPDSLAGVIGSDRSVHDVIGRARVYLPLTGPGYASHVLALQGSFGVARGPNADAGHYEVGGASGSSETATGLDLFGGGPIFFPVRGYDTFARFGRFAWSASAEYRVPLALVNRGVGAWPLHFDRVFASVFVDAGNAWGPTVSPGGFENRLRSALASVGAEVTAEVLTFYKVSMRFRTGVALPLVEGDGGRLYVRLGVPF
jgi:Tol biopolymer transport system component